MDLVRIAKAPAKLAALAGQLGRHEGGRNAISYLKRLGISHADAVDIAKNLKKWASPIESFQRAQTAAYLAGGAADEPRVPRDKDYLHVPDGYLEGTDRVVRHCAELFRRKENDLRANFKPPYGMVIKFSQENRRDQMEDPEEIRPILEFAAQPKFFRILTDYIGEFPVMSTVSLIYTEPNSDTIGPQQFHRDMNERRQLHFVMPIWPIDMETGPFTFLPGDRSSDVVRALRDTGAGRISDEMIFSECRDDELVRITGKPGDVFLVNPYRCIHFGARARSKPRLILIVNFTSLFEGAEGLGAVYRSENRYVLNDGRTETRWLLNI